MPLQCFFSLSTLLYLRVPEKTRLLFRQVGKSLMGTSSRSWERWPRWLGATQVNASSSQVHRPRRFLGGGRKKTPWKRPRFYRGHRDTDLFWIFKMRPPCDWIRCDWFSGRSFWVATGAWCAFLAFRSHHVCSPRELDHDVFDVRNIYFNEMALIFWWFCIFLRPLLGLQVWSSLCFKSIESQFLSRGFKFRLPNAHFLKGWLQDAVAEARFLCRRMSCCEVDEIMIAAWMEELFATTPTQPSWPVGKSSPKVLHDDLVWHM